MNANLSAKIYVVIPAYKVKDHILQVIQKIGAEISGIIVVDDCCPDESGDFVRQNNTDYRVKVIRHSINLGVGGAVMTGYLAAIESGADIIVKVDGDGQMDPDLIPLFCAPIIEGRADYTKGNRFFDLTNIRRMPFARLFGNAVLSFMAKLSSGYWNIFDPTNGYTAISAKVALHLPADKISQRYFFETDMLFRLNTLRAVLIDIPMDAIYGDEKSNLKISKIVGEFLFKHARNFTKRIFYNYLLRDVTVATFELFAGLILFGFGIIFGLVNWIIGIQQHSFTPLGTIMLSALSVLAGMQLLLAFLNYDIANVPIHPISKLLPSRNK